MVGNPITREEAGVLIAEIREGLRNVEVRLRELVERQGWTVLGYLSFQEMWNEELSDIRLATDAMKATVVYALMSEGLVDEEVIAALGGRINDDAVASLRRQRKNGVPSSLASTSVRAHRRRLPHQPTDFRIHLDPDERANWKATIEAHGHNVDEWIVGVLRHEVQKLAQKLERSGVFQ